MITKLVKCYYDFPCIPFFPAPPLHLAKIRYPRPARLGRRPVQLWRLNIRSVRWQAPCGRLSKFRCLTCQSVPCFSVRSFSTAGVWLKSADPATAKYSRKCPPCGISLAAADDQLLPFRCFAGKVGSSRNRSFASSAAARQLLPPLAAVAGVPLLSLPADKRSDLARHGS